MEKRRYVPELGREVVFDDSYPEDYVNGYIAQQIAAITPARRQPPPPSFQPGNEMKGLLSGIPAGLIGAAADIPEGLGGILDSDYLKSMGRGIRESGIGRALTTDRPAEWQGTTGDTAGNIIGQLASLLIPGGALKMAKAPAALSAAQGLLQGAAQASAGQVRDVRAAREAGMPVSSEQETGAARLSAMIEGPLGMLPYGRLLGKISPAGLNVAKTAAGKGAVKIAKDALITGALEGATEAGQGVIHDLIKREIYDAGQPIGENAKAEAVAGAGAGISMDLLLSLLAKGTGKRVMARREALPSKPIEALSDTDSIGIRRGEGGDPLVELLARTQPRRPAPGMPMPLMDDVLSQPVGPPAPKRPRPGQPLPKITEGLPEVTLTPEGAIAEPSPLAMDQPGAPRFSLDAGQGETAYTVESLGKDIADGKKPEIALDVFGEMQRLGVDDLFSTRLIDNLDGSQGRYANRVIDLALSGGNKADLLRTLNHESVHGMKQMGLFTDAEWDLLNSSFNPNNSLTEEERAKYTDLYKDPVKVQEEAVARGIERYAAGEMQAPPPVVSVAAKALGSIDRLGNVLRGKGFQNSDDVLKAFRSGEIGGRNGNQIENRPAGEQVVGPQKDQQTGGGSTSLAGYLTDPEIAEDARYSIVPQLPVSGSSPFGKPDERGFLRKAYDAFVKPSGLGGIGLRGRQNMLDMRAGIEALGRKAGRTDAKTGAEPAIRNFDVSQDFASSALKNGALEYVGTPGNGHFRSNGDTANAPAAVFTEAYQKGKLDRLFHYLAAERSDELLKEGREKKITPQDIADWKAYGQDPDIAQYARRWKAFNDQMVDTLQQSGRINAATAADWKGKVYLPYYRVVDEEVGHQSSGSTLASAPRLERLKGSDLDIGDPSDNIARNVNALTAMAMKNEAMQRVARDGIQTGFIKQVPQPISGQPNMKLWVDGKEKHFEVLDPILYESITASRIPSSVPLAIAGFPAKVLREGVTLDPVFMVNNAARDSTMAWLQGYTDFPMQKIVQSAINAIGNRPSFKAMERAGVIGNSIRGEGGAAGTGKNLRDRYRGSKNILKTMEEASRKSEGITRNTVYEAVLDRTGGDEAQAQYEARELLNFNRRGAWTVIQWVNALIPFQNASWQGADVLYRGLRGKGANPRMQKQLATRMAALAGLSVGYTILASGMEEWQNASPEERDLNWFLPGGAKVKIPFEAGYIAKVLPERITALYMGTDTGKEFIGAFRRFLESTLKMDAVPQFAKPAMEVRSNYSGFRGKEIEPTFMKDREKSQRFDENTTELAKKIGEYTDVLSPLQIDHLLRGYLGSIGTYGVQLGGLLANPDKAASSLSMAEREPHDIPMLGRFFQPKLGSKQIVDFYETGDRAEQAKNAIKAGLEPTQERVDLATYEQSQRPVAKQISQITQAEKKIRAAMGAGHMSPEAARPILREYRTAKIKLAKAANEVSRPLR